MSFNRSASTKEVLEAVQAIEIKNLPSYDINIPQKIDLTPYEFKIPSEHVGSFVNRSLFTTPVKQYANMSKENETTLLRIPATLWLNIYDFLGARSLVWLTMTCKTLGVIANDKFVRNKLYYAQETQKCNKRLAKFVDTKTKRELLMESSSSVSDKSENLRRHFG